MARRTIESFAARQDLAAIWRYLATEASETTADRVLARIYAAIGMITEAPLLGRQRPELLGNPRSWPVTPYVIYYEPLPDGETVLLWRILHGARLAERLIEPPRR